jgi:hypothetical protein
MTAPLTPQAIALLQGQIADNQAAISMANDTLRQIRQSFVGDVSTYAVKADTSAAVAAALLSISTAETTIAALQAQLGGALYVSPPFAAQRGLDGSPVVTIADNTEPSSLNGEPGTVTVENYYYDRG